MKNFKKILIRYNKIKDVAPLNRRFELYVNSLYELFPQNDKTDSLLYGLKLLFIFCSYQDKIIDDVATGDDCILALYFENAYLQWLCPFGEHAVTRYVRSIKTYLNYTERERKNAPFAYNFNNYLEKEQPIIEHLHFMRGQLGHAYKKQIDFIKSYYLAVLFADDTEDIETDIRAGHKTLLTELLSEKGVRLQTLQRKKRKYWEYVDEFFSPWLLSQLQNFSEFSETKVYKSLYAIYKNIQYKLDKKQEITI